MAALNPATYYVVMMDCFTWGGGSSYYIIHLWLVTCQINKVLGCAGWPKYTLPKSWPGFFFAYDLADIGDKKLKMNLRGKRGLNIHCQRFKFQTMSKFLALTKKFVWLVFITNQTYPRYLCFYFLKDFVVLLL
jgi:hypothetical protein